MTQTHPDSIADPSPGTCWAGRFGHPDTRTLLRLDSCSLLQKRFREKRWCYIGIFHPDIIFGCAVVHLGYISSAFMFGFDRAKKQMTETTWVAPPLGQVRYDRNPETGVCSYRSLLGSLHLIHGLPGNATRIRARAGLSGKTLLADIEMMQPDNRFDPMHFLMDMDGGQRAFTTKAAGLCAQGSITLNGRHIRLAPESTFAVLDWTNGFYPRDTFWNWACGTGTADSGVRVGFNLSSGVYTRGLLENVIWINNIPHRIGPVDYVYDPDHPLHPWQVNSRDNTIRLQFTPEGIRQASDNFGVVKSRFIQACGSYSGTIRLAGTDPVLVHSAAGVAEEHYAFW